MEEILNLISHYAVFPIALLCFLVGYAIKHYISKIPNKFIPIILACLGLVLNLAFNHFAFSFEVIITGIASGLVATGSFEAIRNLASNKKETTKE